MCATRGPKAHWFYGHLREFRADRLGFFSDCARTYGDVVPLRLPGKRLLLFSRPDLIEQVLVTQSKNFIKHFGLRMYKPVLGNGLVMSEGDFWRRQRKLSAPAFQATHMSGYVAEMVSSAARISATWPTIPHVRDVHVDMMQLTLEIACRTLFGTDACPDPRLVGDSMHQALSSIDVRFSRPIPIPDWFPAPSNLRLRRAMRTLDAVVGGIIDRRRCANGNGRDTSGGGGGGENLLSALLRARDEDGSAMTDEQLLDEVRTIFLAGHETTALALAYSLYLLATNPAAQDELYGELSQVLNGRLPTYEDLPRLAYTRNVVTESMRLYPPADVLGREAVGDCDINGVQVSKGTNVFLSQWVMHHDPRYFPQPQTFAPHRWTEQFEKSLPRFAYFPFGGGPRYCVGQAFASAEAAVVLATLCQRFAFAPDPAFEIELWPSITLRPRNGIRLIVSGRKAS
jgi:cytochrome P450